MLLSPSKVTRALKQSSQTMLSPVTSLSACKKTNISLSLSSLAENQLGAPIPGSHSSPNAKQSPHHPTNIRIATIRHPTIENSNTKLLMCQAQLNKFSLSFLMRRIISQIPKLGARQTVSTRTLLCKKRAFPRPILPKDRKTLVVESVGIDEIYGFVDFVGRGYGIWFWRISVIVVGALPPG